MLAILYLSQIISAQIQFQKGTFSSSQLSVPLDGNTLSDEIVQFTVPFENIPKILLSFSSLDGWYDAGFHFFASEVTQTQFKINYNIFTTHQIVALDVDWLAIVHDGIQINDYQFTDIIFPDPVDERQEYTQISTLQVKNSGQVVSFMNGFSQNTLNRYFRHSVKIQLIILVEKQLFKYNRFLSVQIISIFEQMNWKTQISNSELEIGFQDIGIYDQNFQINFPTEFQGYSNILYMFGVFRLTIEENYRLHLRIPFVSTQYLKFSVEKWGMTYLKSLSVNFLFFLPTMGYKLNAFDNKYFPICGDLVKTIYEECDDFTPQCRNCFQSSDDNCVTFLGTQCFVCREGFQLVFDQCLYIQTLDINSSLQLIQESHNVICDFNCQLCSSYGCLSCKVGYILYDYGCYESCSSVDVIYWEKECDDFNSKQFDGCYECRFQCDQNCLICEYGKCIECSEGYYPEGSGCSSKCGDLVISGQEQCEDQNTNLFDGCYNCQYQCQDQCELCVQGNCLKCKFGWYQSLNKCFEIICGDIFIQGTEECDDGNNIQFDGCFNCKLECDINCSSCIGGFCYKCQDGWYLTNSNSCESKCGDGIVVEPLEQCDDGNNEKYDGCYDCQFQCEISCTQCDEGQCLQCYEGYQLNSLRVCQTVCGDSIIMGLEECDDGNDDPYDDCDNCQGPIKECDSMICDICVKNECIICETGYYPVENTCKSKCGDGILIESIEQCDDNNTANGDGCSQDCMIETGYICVQQTISQCDKIDSPSMYLAKQKLNNYESMVIVKFTQLLKLQSDIESSNPIDQISISLDQVDQSYFTTDLVIIQKANHQLNDVEYQFRITFLQSVVKPQALVKINVVLSNEYDNILLNTQASINLDSSELLSNFQLELSQTTLDLGKYQIYILLAIIGLSIITMNMDVFLNCLDIIQYLSYLQYINFEFPVNLELFFDSFQYVQVGFYLNPNFITIKYDVDFTQNILSAGKFMYYQLNPNIGVNLVGILILYCVSLLITLVFQKVNQQVDKYYSENYLEMSLRTTKIIYHLKKICNEMSQTSQLGIYIFFTCNAYEILFACYLQLLQREDQYIRVMQGRQVIAFLILLIYFVNALKYFQKIKYFKQTQHIVCYGIEANGSYWQLQSNNIFLMKKMLFLFGITMCQDEGVIAIALIMLTQMMEILFIWFQNPFRQRFKEIIVGILTIIVILSLLTYSKNWKSITYQQKVNCGWITIGGLVLILAFQIIVDSISGIIRIVKYFKRKPQIKEKNK